MAESYSLKCRYCFLPLRLTRKRFDQLVDQEGLPVCKECRRFGTTGKYHISWEEIDEDIGNLGEAQEVIRPGG